MLTHDKNTDRYTDRQDLVTDKADHPTNAPAITGMRKMHTLHSSLVAAEILA